MNWFDRDNQFLADYEIVWIDSWICFHQAGERHPIASGNAVQRVTFGHCMNYSFICYRLAVIYILWDADALSRLDIIWVCYTVKGILYGFVIPLRVISR